MKKTALALLVGCGVLPLFAIGCSGATTDQKSVDISRATLHRVATCADLSAALREDARAKLNKRVDSEIRAIREGMVYGYGYRGGYGMPNAAPTEAAGAATKDSSTSAASPAPAHSDTETQVKGVDEADIVKTDGNHIFLLHGDKFLIVNSWPVKDLGEASATSIEGAPLEMYVADGRAVVFSRVDGAPIYQASGIKPKPAYNEGYAYGSYGYGGGGVAMGAADVAMPSPGGNGYVPSSSPLTKVTVLSLNGTSASVTKELYFEGNYVSSRRVGGKVRIVLGGGAHGPTLDSYPTMPTNPATPVAESPTVGSGTSSGGVPSTTTPSSPTTPTQADQINAWEKLRQKNLATIDASQFSDWVPFAFVKNGGSTSVAPTSCGDFYVPTPGTTAFGMTEIATIDLDADATPKTTTIVGEVTTVYGNEKTMILTERAYEDPWEAQTIAWYTYGGSGKSASPSSIPVKTLDHTHLHLFDLTADPSNATYAGSGTVAGSVKDQFSLDERSGSIRVTTTEQRSGPPRTDGKSNQVSHVFVLQNQQGYLAQTGDAGEIAPGEQLYATRAIGDKVYVVTWHVTDPLFVVDVADAYHPRVMGQVQIPGFSEYMHPLDDTHLLTIGRETDSTGHQHTDGGYWYGLSLQIFDFTNSLAPALRHKYVFDGGDYATSEATSNHKAFTYFDDKKLLAFPYVRQSSYGSYKPGSSLQVFKASVDDGISPVGAVDHTSMLGTLPQGGYGYCGGYFDGAVRRGVFVENVVYSISYGGIVASDVTGLSTVGSLKLEAPTMQTGNVCTGTR